jgi:GlpG protein
MREIGKLPDAPSARAFAGYLQSQSIDTKLEESAGGVSIWVIEEDRVARAREEFQQYLRSPGDERYRHAAPPKPDPERFAAAPVVSPRRRRPRSEGFFATPEECRLTLVLIVLSVLVTLLYGGADQRGFVREHLFIREILVQGGELYTRVLPGLLPEVQGGQVWRLVTPIFIHFAFLHIAFNLFMLYALGGQIERLLGPLKYGLLVLFLAAFSNMGQYFFSDLSVQDWSIVIPARSPVFGGMSGVVYGLFGYIWMRMVYQPGCGLILRPSTIMILMIWFFLCFTGAVGSVANTAHMVGLVLGMICGYIGAWLSGWGQRNDQ